MDKSKSEEETYLSLINDAIAEDIKLIAITDHNTFNGYKEDNQIIVHDLQDNLTKHQSNLPIQ